MATAHPASNPMNVAASDSAVTIIGDGSAALNLYYKLDEYTVAFNVNGTETSADYYYGAVPAYDGGTPTLAATDEFTYTFLGWTEGAAAQPGQELFGIEATNDGLVIFGGGELLIRKGVIVGAIGVSGGSVAEDTAVAQAGAAALE